MKHFWIKIKITDGRIILKKKQFKIKKIILNKDRINHIFWDFSKKSKKLPFSNSIKK